MKVLVVEDQLELLEAIEEALSDSQFVCETASTFTKAIEKVNLYTYDVLVVDINLPDGTGLDVIRQLKRERPDTGVIVVSARDALDDKLEGLELGADDYITKPFAMAELVARVKALMRRRQFGGNNLLSFGELTVDPENRTAHVGNKHVILTKSEFPILLFFLSNQGRVVSRETLAEHIWGDNMDLSDSFDFIYSHIKNLRKKLSSDNFSLPIKSVYGIGYKLEPIDG